MWAEIVAVLWFIWPAYMANSFAINVSGVSFLKKYKQPIDGGLEVNGKRLFGPGKTWRGFFAGILFAVLTGVIQSIYQTDVGFWYANNFPGSALVLTEMTITLAFLLGLGAMLGDLAGSFLKRRCGLDRGACVPFLDQWDYIFGAYALALIITPFSTTLFIWTLIVTIPLHIGANILAWSINLKKVPW
ncbi:CDP-2,3-bis-(O-geranylgeranyl)-sn-glycerol synthase [Candidatus Altiarchaeota archaeon]